VGDVRVGGWWLEEGSIGFPSAERFGHSSVDFEDDAFCTVLAVLLLVLALNFRRDLSPGLITIRRPVPLNLSELGLVGFDLAEV